MTTNEMRTIKKDEQVRIWKETMAANLKVTSRHSPAANTSNIQIENDTAPPRPWMEDQISRGRCVTLHHTRRRTHSLIYFGGPLSNKNSGLRIKRR
jgi:hypothetical protein